MIISFSCGTVWHGMRLCYGGVFVQWCGGFAVWYGFLVVWDVLRYGLKMLFFFCGVVAPIPQNAMQYPKNAIPHKKKKDAIPYHRITVPQSGKTGPPNHKNAMSHHQSRIPQQQKRVFLPCDLSLCIPHRKKCHTIPQDQECHTIPHLPYYSSRMLERTFFMHQRCIVGAPQVP